MRTLASRLPFVDDIRPWLYHSHQQSIKTAILTLVNVEGSSPRPVGSQMAVNEGGKSIGLVSGGCVESALVLEAQRAIASNKSYLVRYGRESDFFDIRLPCGSGIDILITPNPPSQFVDSLYQHYVKRKTAFWNISLQNPAFSLNDSATVLPGKTLIKKSEQLSRQALEDTDLVFSKCYQPRHRIVVVGQGEIFNYFLSMANFFDIDLIAYSTGGGLDGLSEENRCINREYRSLTSPDKFDPALLDNASSLILLSHEHEWETPVLMSALTTPVTHIAALGSRRTHQTRLELLRSEGVDGEECSRIKGPAGIDIGGFSPPEIAMSILAEVVAKFNHR